MNRIFTVQTELLKRMTMYDDPDVNRDYPLAWEKIHMASCAKIGQFLAVKRKADPVLAAIACSIHDYGRIVTGKQVNHALNGYEPVMVFLTDCEIFTPEEIEALAQAVKNHSSKKIVGTSLEEIVKDADVLDCHQYGEALERPEQRDRLKKVLEELGLS